MKKKIFEPKFNLREINFLMKLIHDSKTYKSKIGGKVQLKLYWIKET